ncbi:MAG TPA: hypothetical protein VK841_26145 [Polyangiaceae bacterium]|nr:hypothetical protein [Polyangiaceae bacterium]
MRDLLRAGFFVLGAFIACTPASSGLPYVSCTEDSDCNTGLRCLTNSLPELDGGCTSVGMECVQPCSQDSECTATLGSGYACLQGPCGASIPICQPIVETDGASSLPSDASASDATIVGSDI